MHCTDRQAYAGTSRQQAQQPNMACANEIQAASADEHWDYERNEGQPNVVTNLNEEVECKHCDKMH
jgi:hypothetical protein